MAVRVGDCCEWGVALIGGGEEGQLRRGEGERRGLGCYRRVLPWIFSKQK